MKDGKKEEEIEESWNKKRVGIAVIILLVFIGGLLYLLNSKFFKPGQNAKVLSAKDVKLEDMVHNQIVNLKKEASQLELGCPHFPNIFALGGALELLDSIGQENIKTRIFELNSYLVGRLAELNLEIGSPLEDKYRSGITIVKIPNAKEVVEKLISRNIIVSQRGEGVRVSMHIYNNKEDIDTFIETLEVLIR